MRLIVLWRLEYIWDHDGDVKSLRVVSYVSCALCARLLHLDWRT